MSSYLRYTLQLSNFGCHQELELEFSSLTPRVNIAGASGSGKTTVLEAILFVLTEHHAVKYLPWDNKKAVVVTLTCYKLTANAASSNSKSVTADNSVMVGPARSATSAPVNNGSELEQEILWSIKRGRRPNILEVYTCSDDAIVKTMATDSDSDSKTAGRRNKLLPSKALGYQTAKLVKQVVYQKELATAWINRKFGSDLLLNSICMFSQSDGWSLLTATSKKDKNNLLEEVLTDDTRAVYEARLDSLLQMQQVNEADNQQLKLQSSQLHNSLTGLTADIDQHEVNDICQCELWTSYLASLTAVDGSGSVANSNNDDSGQMTTVVDFQSWLTQTWYPKALEDNIHSKAAVEAEAKLRLAELDSEAATQQLQLQQRLQELQAQQQSLQLQLSALEQQQQQVADNEELQTAAVLLTQQKQQQRQLLSLQQELQQQHEQSRQQQKSKLQQQAQQQIQQQQQFLQSQKQLLQQQVQQQIQQQQQFLSQQQTKLQSQLQQQLQLKQQSLQTQQQAIEQQTAHQRQQLLQQQASLQHQYSSRLMTINDELLVNQTKLDKLTKTVVDYQKRQRTLTDSSHKKLLKLQQQLQVKSAALADKNQLLASRVATASEVVELSQQLTNQSADHSNSQQLMDKQIAYLERYHNLLADCRLTDFQDLVAVDIPTSRQLQACKLKGEVERYRKFQLHPVDYSSSAFLARCPHCQGQLLIDPAVDPAVDSIAGSVTGSTADKSAVRKWIVSSQEGSQEGNQEGNQEDSRESNQELASKQQRLYYEQWQSYEADYANYQDVIIPDKLADKLPASASRLLELRKLLPDRYINIKQLLLSKVGLTGTEQEPNPKLLAVRDYRLLLAEQQKLTAEVAAVSEDTESLQASLQADGASYADMINQLQLQQQEVSSHLSKLKSELANNQSTLDSISDNLEVDINQLTADSDTELTILTAALQAEVDSLQLQLQSELDGLTKSSQAEVEMLSSRLQADMSALDNDGGCQLDSLRSGLQAELASLDASIQLELDKINGDLQLKLDNLNNLIETGQQQLTQRLADRQRQLQEQRQQLLQRQAAAELLLTEEMADIKSKQKALTTQLKQDKLTVDKDCKLQVKSLMGQLEELKANYSNTTTWTKQWLHYLSLWQQYDEVKLQYDEVTVSLSQLTSQRDELSAIETAINNCHNWLLQQKLEDINDIIDQALQRFFPDCQCTFSCLKTLKSKNHQIRAEVGVKISYRNFEVKLSDLSGGQQARVQAACLAAWCQLTAWPIIMLDESLSYLPSDVRQEIVDCLSELCPSKIFLIINHDSVSSHYDTCINVETMVEV